MSVAPIWITGAGGLIGNWLVQTAPTRSEPKDVVALTRESLELTDFAAVTRRFRAEHPRLVIHCAAMSRSPDCQKNPGQAHRVNVEVTRILHELAAAIPLVFFSTDLVFDGKEGDYVETAKVNPLSVYAETKAAAEQIVLANPLHTVLRTSLNCGRSPSGDRGFDEQLCRAWQAGQTLKLFTDEFRCPIAAAVTARATWELVARNRPGLYHLAGSQRLSRYEIGRVVAEQHPELHPKIEPASLKSYAGAPRSPDTSLNCAKIQGILSFPLPAFDGRPAESRA